MPPRRALKTRDPNTQLVISTETPLKRSALKPRRKPKLLQDREYQLKPAIKRTERLWSTELVINCLMIRMYHQIP